MDENIEKIRRNLIISSFVMFLIIYANITIPEKINLFDIGISVKSPANINVFIFGIGIYFLIRFFHSIKYDDLQFKESFLISSLNAMGKYIKPIFQKLENTYFESRSFPDDEAPRNKINDILRSKRYQTQLPQNMGNQINKTSWFEYEWLWERMNDQEDPMAQAMCAETIKIPKRIVLKSYVAALVTTILSKNIFEYHLPLIFGTITLVLFACNKLFEGLNVFKNILLY